MNKYILIILAGTVLLATSCKKKRSEPETPQPPVTTTPGTTNPPGTSVETNPPNSRYSPAFTGQTRANAVRTATAYQATVITSSLTSPWGIAALPDGRFLVTEKAGNIRSVSASGSVSAPITGIPAVNSSGQGGLLGLCIDPAFPTNRMVYWSFSERRSEGNVLAVAKGRLSSNNADMENV